MKSFFWISTGCFQAALAIMLGAFGAHALKNNIEKDALEIYETGNKYHIYHALGLVLIGIILKTTPLNKTRSAKLLNIGIILFSGSLYILSVTGIKKLGMITPIGGICFITGWLLIGMDMLVLYKNNKLN